MKIDYDRGATYMSGGGRAIWNDKFDFLLVRQDFNGFESVYFNVDEIDDVFKKIECGEIPIHYSYSVLYGKDRETLDKIPEAGYEFPCYEAVWEKR